MNMYLLALISVIVAFAVGFVVYGQLFKTQLGTAGEKLDPMHLAMTTAMVYLASLAFIYVFDHFSVSGLTGGMKGLTLGLLLGVGIFAMPLFADSGFFKAKMEVTTAVVLNWIVSFALVGIVVGMWR